MNGDLKQTFILKCVQDYLQSVEATIKEILRRKNIGVTEDLLNSIRSRASAAGNGATGELLFKEYGRFVDMGAGRGHPLGGLTTTKVALQSKQQQGLAFIKDNVRKPKKFYSPVIYGKLTYLQNKLLYGYTEEVIASLKQMQPSTSTPT